MIVVTGAAGFIGSVLVGKLNESGLKNLILVDDFSKQEKAKNLESKMFVEKVERDGFFDWFDEHSKEVELVLHIGARTDTTEFDVEIFNALNLNYSICFPQLIVDIYKSSTHQHQNEAIQQDYFCTNVQIQAFHGKPFPIYI